MSEDSTDPSQVPLLSATTSSTSSFSFSFPDYQPPKVTPPPPPYQEVPTETSTETTRVLVRKLSKRNSVKSNGSLPTFTVTKVSSDKKDLLSGVKCLPTFVEDMNETDDNTSSRTSPTSRPPLRRQVLNHTQKYSNFHSRLKRVPKSLESQLDKRVVLSQRDEKPSTAIGCVSPSLTSSKSSLKASQTDLTEIYKTRSSVISKSQLREVAERGRVFAKRKTFRLVHQTGECNIQYVNVDKRGARFLLDIFTTLVALKWQYNILIYLVSFILSWVLFALVWWALHIMYGVDEDGMTCVQGVYDFPSAFLYSLETQHTIGYGSRFITNRCPPAVCLLILQSVFGAVMQCVVTGIVFAKLARPNQRAETVMFSKKAVICLDSDGTLCLAFRVGDMRSSQLIGVSINTVLVHKALNSQRRTMQLEQECLRTTTEANRQNEDLAGFYFLAWPIKVIHRIDEKSPLWNLSPNDFLVANFEIVVVLEATCEATGATIQVRTSYLPSEILWGHSLISLVTYQKDNGRFKIDYSHFHEVKPVATPEKSAYEIGMDRNRCLRRAPSDSFEILDETKANGVENIFKSNNCDEVHGPQLEQV